VGLGRIQSITCLIPNSATSADDRERQYVTGLVHQVPLAFLAAVSAVVAVMMLGLHGGPNGTSGISIYQFFGYSLLVIGATLVLRVLVVAVRPTTS
jgi:ubiquinone biosynthesis protein